MLLQNSPFRDLDQFFDQVTRPTATSVPMDAYRRGSDVWVHLDLPGVASNSIDITVERNVLTVAGHRGWQRQDGDRTYLTERKQGTFRRQVTLGEGLDAEGIEADYSDGVLTLRVPVAEKAQPRKITVNNAAVADAATNTVADAIETTES